jgi:hypothetical protein
VLFDTVTYRLDKARENENEKCNKSRDGTIDTERAYEEHLNEHEIKRGNKTDERGRLEYATQKPIKDDDLQSGKNENDTVENDTVLREWDAEEMRVLTRCNDIAARKILNIAQERRTARLVLCDISGIRESRKGENQYEYDTHAFHTA